MLGKLAYVLHQYWLLPGKSHSGEPGLKSTVPFVLDYINTIF